MGNIVLVTLSPIYIFTAFVFHSPCYCVTTENHNTYSKRCA